MQTHTARLIITIIFLVLATTDAVRGYWFSAIVWGLVVFAVGHPFVRGGRLDLYYDDSPVYVRWVATMTTATPPARAPGPAPAAT